MNLKTRAKNKYRHDGPVGVLIGGKNILKRILSRNVISPFIVTYLSENVLTGEGLRSYVQNEGDLLLLPDESTGNRQNLTGPVDFGRSAPRSVENPIIEPYSFPRPFVATIPNARLVGSTPLGVTDDGQIILDTIIHTLRDNTRLEGAVNQILLDDGAGFTLRELTPLLKSTETESSMDIACLLTSRWNNFGHWTAEHLLKLRLIEEYVSETGIKPTLIVQNDPPRYVRDYLDVLGYETDDYYCWNERAMSVENLVVPRYQHPTPETAQWLRRRILSNVDQYVRDDFETNARVFISREKATKKRIQNRSEVKTVLSDYGFETYVMEDLHITEQALLFAEADIIVGASGSAFLNLLYSDEAHLLELVSLRPGCFWYRIGEMLDLDHDFIFCEQRGPTGWDLVVDTDELDAKLQAIV